MATTYGAGVTWPVRSSKRAFGGSVRSSRVQGLAVGRRCGAGKNSPLPGALRRHEQPGNDGDVVTCDGEGSLLPGFKRRIQDGIWAQVHSGIGAGAGDQAWSSGKAVVYWIGVPHGSSAPSGLASVSRAQFRIRVSGSPKVLRMAQSGSLRNEPRAVGSGPWIARRPELWQAADGDGPRTLMDGGSARFHPQPGSERLNLQLP